MIPFKRKKLYRSTGDYRLIPHTDNNAARKHRFFNVGIEDDARKFTLMMHGLLQQHWPEFVQQVKVRKSSTVRQPFTVSYKKHQRNPYDIRDVSIGVSGPLYVRSTHDGAGRYMDFTPALPSILYALEDCGPQFACGLGFVWLAYTEALGMCLVPWKMGYLKSAADRQKDDYQSYIAANTEELRMMLPLSVAYEAWYSEHRDELIGVGKQCGTTQFVTARKEFQEAGIAKGAYPEPEKRERKEADDEPMPVAPPPGKHFPAPPVKHARHHSGVESNFAHDGNVSYITAHEYNAQFGFDWQPHSPVDFPPEKE